MSSYSFAEVFETPMELSHGHMGIISKIVIPKIQRPYAQGRTDTASTRIRNRLLKDIFKALKTGKELELNFVYGNILTNGNPDCNGSHNVMELLDGQQRLTTLFLIHWYVTVREYKSHEVVPNRMKKCLHGFVYETRITSSDFCQRLSDFHPDLCGKNRPSFVIRNSVWYRHCFDCDSSVVGMLRMLDAIHEKYEQETRCGDNPIYANLDKIKFYIQSIGEYPFKEDLYIKMNARGLQLSVFEVFKADYAGVLAEMESPPSKFIERMDTRWIDIFWTKEHHDDFDVAYFKFISRTLAALYIADHHGDEREDEVVKLLYTATNTDNGPLIYPGVEVFLQLLKDYTRILEYIFECYFYNAEILQQSFAPSWQERNIDSKKSLLDEVIRQNMSQPYFVLFASIVCFIRRMMEYGVPIGSPIPEAAFGAWMRLSHNIIENSSINDIKSTTALIRKMDGYAKTLNIASMVKAYASFVEEAVRDNAPAVKEELEKAVAICANPDWESVLRKAESHPFFRGDVHCIFMPDMDPHIFEKRYMRACSIFVKGGISENYRGSEHLLIRAIVSDFKTWSELNQYFITEVQIGDNPYLKNNIKKPLTKQLLAKILDAKDDETAFDILRAHIKKAQIPDDNDSLGFIYGADAFRLAVKYLRSTPKLYDFVASNENSSSFRIYDSYERSLVLARYRGKRRIYLDTDRGLLAQRVEQVYHYSFCQPHQKEQVEECKLCFGDELRMRKELADGVKLELVFGSHHKIFMEIFGCSSDRTLAEALDKTKQWNEEHTVLRLNPELYHYAEDQSLPKLKEWLAMVEDEFNA